MSKNNVNNEKTKYTKLKLHLELEVSVANQN